jgi:hypothetical protein
VVVAVIEPNPGAVRVGMAEDVGQRLLHGAKHGQVDAGGNRPRLARDVERHVQPAAAGALDQLREVMYAGRRGTGRDGAILAPPQHVQHRPQLAERLLAGVLDGGQRGSGLVGSFVQQVEGGACLHVDQRDVVGQDVMKLAGDEQALLARPVARLLGLDIGQLRPPFPPAAGALGAGAQHQQPGGQAQRLPQVGCPLVGDQRREQHESQIANRESAPGEGPGSASIALTKAKISAGNPVGPSGASAWLAEKVSAAAKATPSDTSGPRRRTRCAARGLRCCLPG